MVECMRESHEFLAEDIGNGDITSEALISNEVARAIIIAKEDCVVAGMEVAVSLASGDGKEHMAMISALLKLPIGVKFVALTKEGVAEF